MHEKLLKYKGQISEKWGETDKGLKIKISVISVGLVVILALLLYISFKPNWIVLTSNADVGVVGKMETLLTTNNITSRLIDRATGIEVKESDLNKAKIAIAGSDITKDAINFTDATASMGIGMTEGDKNEQYKRIKEAEMKQLIETFENVKEATVMLALPDETVIFNNDKKIASAGVTLSVTDQFTREQGSIIANLIASGVEGISAENVEIADTKGNTLYSNDENGEYSYTRQEEIERAKRDEISEKIQDSLDPLYDEIKVLSSIKFDWNKKQEKSTTYTPPIDDATVGVPRTSNEETESVVNGTAGAEPGVAANDQNPPNYALGGNEQGQYDASKNQTDYIYNSHEQTNEVAVGTILPEQSSIAVTVYRHRYFNEEILEEDGTINNEMTWEQFKEENKVPTIIEIDEQVLATVRTGTGIENITITGYESPMFIDKITVPMKIEQIVILLVLALLIILLAIALIKKTQPDEIEEVEPEISIEDLIATNKREDEEIAEKLAMITEIESEFKTKINDFIDKKPEVAAQLLKNWLNDEWE